MAAPGVVIRFGSVEISHEILLKRIILSYPRVLPPNFFINQNMYQLGDLGTFRLDSGATTFLSKFRTESDMDDITKIVSSINKPLSISPVVMFKKKRR